MSTHVQQVLSTWQTRNEKVAPLSEVRSALNLMHKAPDQVLRVRLLTRRLEKELANPSPRD